MSRVISSGHFSSLAVSNNAKLNDVVFDSISLTGDTYSLATTGNISLVTSAGSATVMANSDVTIDSVAGSVILETGNEFTTDGSIIMRHDNGNPVINMFYDSASDTDRLGFFGSTPVIQPVVSTTSATFVANTSGITDGTATYAGYTVEGIVVSLINLGILAP